MNRDGLLEVLKEFYIGNFIMMKSVLGIGGVILLLISSSLFANSGMREIKLAFCEGKDKNVCAFYFQNQQVRVGDQHIGRSITIYNERSMVFTGDIESYYTSKKNGSQIVYMNGVWWNQSLPRTLILNKSPLSLMPNELKVSSLESKVKKNAKTIKKAKKKKKAKKYVPDFSVFGRIGSPESSSAANGLALECSCFAGKILTEASYGWYSATNNTLTDEPAKKIKTFGLGGSFLLGEGGSQLTIGSNIAFSNTKTYKSVDEKRAEFKNYVGIIPRGGVRFTSDNHYVLAIDFGQYFGVGGDMKGDLGKLPEGSSLLGSGKTTTVIGIGMGI